MSDKILYFCTVWEIFPPQFWKVFLHPAINWLRCSRPGSKPSTHPQLNPLTMDFNHFSALFTVMQSKRCHFGTVTCEKPAPNFVDMTSNIVNSNSVCNIEKVSILKTVHTSSKKSKKGLPNFHGLFLTGQTLFSGLGGRRCYFFPPNTRSGSIRKSAFGQLPIFRIGKKNHPPFISSYWGKTMIE